MDFQESAQILQENLSGLDLGGIELTEMVASLSVEDQETYDEVSGSKPVKICPGSISYVRRPRLFWVNLACSLEVSF